jgi:hypothetical protein
MGWQARRLSQLCRDAREEAEEVLVPVELDEPFDSIAALEVGDPWARVIRGHGLKGRPNERAKVIDAFSGHQSKLAVLSEARQDGYHQGS